MAELRVRRASDRELATCQAIRREVFVRGQDVPEALELDGRDRECLHWLAEWRGRPVGTARLRSLPGEAGGERGAGPTAKVERVAVLDEARGLGIGRALMDALERHAAEAGVTDLTLNAQESVIDFYDALGYRPVGARFVEADIPHQRMDKQLDT